MGAAKDLLLKNTELRDRLASVTHADWFKTVLVYVSAEFNESCGSADEFKGARKFRDILVDMAEEPPQRPVMPKPGLHHHIDRDIDKSQPKKEK